MHVCIACLCPRLLTAWPSQRLLAATLGLLLQDDARSVSSVWRYLIASAYGAASHFFFCFRSTTGSGQSIRRYNRTARRVPDRMFWGRFGWVLVRPSVRPSLFVRRPRGSKTGFFPALTPVSFLAARVATKSLFGIMVQFELKLSRTVSAYFFVFLLFFLFVILLELPGEQGWELAVA